MTAICQDCESYDLSCCRRSCHQGRVPSLYYITTSGFHRRLKCFQPHIPRLKFVITMSQCARQQVRCYNPSYPTFLIGSSEIPAPLLPVGIALAYIIWLWSGRPKGLIAKSAEKSRAEKSPTAHDEENLTGHERPRSAFLSWEKALQWIHQIYTMTGLVTGGRHQLRPFKEICVVQIAYVIGTDIYFDQSISLDNISLSVGWLLLLVRDAAPSTVSSLGKGLTVVLLMTTPAYLLLPQSSSKQKSRNLDNVTVASLLVILAGRSYLDTDAWPAPLNLDTALLSPWALMPTLLILGAKDIACSWYTMSGSNTSTLNRFKALMKDVCFPRIDIVSDFFRPLLATGLIYGLVIPVSFLSSCLPFRRLLTGLPSKPPAFGGTGLLAGMFVYMPIALIWLAKAYKEGMSRKEKDRLGFEICVESVARTVVILVAIAGSLQSVGFFSKLYPSISAGF